jgi:MFS family permease
MALQYNAAFHPSRMVLMLGVTLIITVGCALAPLLGAAMDRRSLRGLLMIAALLLTAAFLTLSFTTSMLQVLIVYGAMIAIAKQVLGHISTNALLARWFTRRRGMAMGLAGLGSSIGAFIFPPLLQELITAFGWRAALQILAAIVFVVLVPAIRFLAINWPSDRNLYPDGESAPATAPAAERPSPNLTTGNVLRDPSFWLIAIATGLPFAGATGMVANMVPLVIAKGIDPTHAALLLSSMSVGTFSGKVLFAGLSDRIDSRIALAVCLVGVSASMLCFWYGAGYALMVLSSFLLGITIGAVGPLWGYLLARGFGAQNMGLVMGLIALVTMPLTLVAAPFFGFVFDETGSYNDALLIVAGLCIAALLSLPRIRMGLRNVAAPALS